MSQFINFGSGNNGVATLSGTDAPIDSSTSGTVGTTSLSATNASFAAGQQILIHQSRGTSPGVYEVNYIASYVAGTITTVFPLDNTYTDSGASQAQVLVLKQYAGVTISGTLTAKAWGRDVGGIFAIACSGKVTISGTLDIKGTTWSAGAGYRGGQVAATNPSQYGEGTAGDIASGSGANGNGGGGGANTAGGGAGGGNGTAGSNGGGSGGTGGSTAGAADLTTMVFGGGGGGGGSQGGSGATGGEGGGIVLIFSRIIEVTGSINANGSVGGAAGVAGAGGGGGGAGGSIFIKSANAILGTGLLTATGGAGGAGGSGGNAGGTGGDGRVRIEVCGRTGSTNPAASEQLGGFNFCGGASAIIG